MTILHLTGRVLPEHPRITYTFPRMIFGVPDQLHLHYELAIEESEVKLTVEIETTSLPQEVLLAAITVAVRQLINLVGFKYGIGFWVHLEAFSGPSGKTYLTQDPAPLPDASHLRKGGYSDELFNILSDWNVSLALNDLLQTLREPTYVAVNSARAVEGLRYAIAPDLSALAADKRDKALWEAFHKALRTTPSYVRVITDAARNPRHGNRIPDGETTEVNTEIARRAWAIMYRYVDFRMRGNTLPEGEFPILT